MKKLYDENIVGKTFNSMICLEKLKRDKFGVAWFLWKCSCGKEIEGRAADVVRGKKKSCGCRRFRTGKENPNWGGCGDITGNLWGQIKRGSRRKSRTLPFEISMNYVWELYKKQNGICALSGVKLSMPLSHRDKSYTASLDRIDSSKGYIEGNVQWVHKDVNIMKQDLPDEVFVDWCKKISYHQLVK